MKSAFRQAVNEVVALPLVSEDLLAFYTVTDHLVNARGIKAGLSWNGWGCASRIKESLVFMVVSFFPQWKTLERLQGPISTLSCFPKSRLRIMVCGKKGGIISYRSSNHNNLKKGAEK